MTTDVITRGVERSTGKPPFESSAPPPPPAENDPIDVVSRGVPDAIEGGSDEERIRASVSELKKQRERDWESGAISDDAFAGQNAPILERRYDGRDTEAKSLKTATTDLSNQHWIERPETEILRSQGWSDEQILKLGKNEDWLIGQIGYTPQEAAEYARRGEVPPLKVTAVRDDGRVVRPLPAAQHSLNAPCKPYSPPPAKLLASF